MHRRTEEPGTQRAQLEPSASCPSKRERSQRRREAAGATGGKAPRNREGAVMLVVLLILMVATASAAITVEATQSELKAAGHDRIALQARYASEAAIITTISWIDMLGDSGQWLDTWDQWDAQSAPTMAQFGEPELTATTRHHATRSSLRLQMLLQADTVYGCPTSGCITPLTGPQSASGSPDGGTGDAGTPSGIVDEIGSFGPKQAYQPANDYAVDVNDCMMAPSAAVPGAPIGGGPGSLKVVQFYCVLTARGRIDSPSSGQTRDWTLAGGNTYRQQPFAAMHDSRATILTPQMIVPAE